MYGMLYTPINGDTIMGAADKAADKALAIVEAAAKSNPTPTAERNLLVNRVAQAERTAREIAQTYFLAGPCQGSLDRLNTAHANVRYALAAVRDYDNAQAAKKAEEEKRKNPPLMTPAEAVARYEGLRHRWGYQTYRLVDKASRDFSTVVNEVNEAARLHYKAAVEREMRSHLGVDDSTPAYKVSILDRLARRVFDSKS